MKSKPSLWCAGEDRPGRPAPPARPFERTGGVSETPWSRSNPASRTAGSTVGKVAAAHHALTAQGCGAAKGRHAADRRSPHDPPGEGESRFKSITLEVVANRRIPRVVIAPPTPRRGERRDARRRALLAAPAASSGPGGGRSRHGREVERSPGRARRGRSFALAHCASGRRGRPRGRCGLTMRKPVALRPRSGRPWQGDLLAEASADDRGRSPRASRACPGPPVGPS